MPAVLASCLILLLLPAVRAETVAVLPYFNLTKAKNLDWVGESLSETLAEAVAGAGLLVVRREDRDEGMRAMAVRRYVPLTQGSVAEIGLNLDADIVISGEFETPTPETIRIVTRVANLRLVKRWPAVSEQGALDELSILGTTTAWEVVRMLAPAVAGSAPAYRTAHPAIRLNALESYARGLMADGFDQKHRLFTAAALADPAFSLPPLQLGLMQFQRRNYRTAAEWFEKVKEGSSRYREARFYLGLSRYYSGDFAAAEGCFARVAQEVPLAEVWNNLGSAQLHTRPAAAVASFEKAVEIDPSDPAYRFNLGYALWKNGDHSAAVEQFRATLARIPDDQTATLLLGRSLTKAGPRPGEVRVESQERLKTNYDESAWRHLKAVLKQ